MGVDLFAPNVARDSNKILAQTVNGTLTSTYSEEKENPLPITMSTNNNSQRILESSVVTDFKSNINENLNSIASNSGGDHLNLEQRDGVAQQPMHFDQAVGFLNKIKVIKIYTFLLFSFINY